MNDLFLRALRCEPTERPPIWLMRQAGRYLPQYRELRKKYSFHELIHTPELAKAVTLQPIQLLGFDAAILFSDILVLTEVFGYQMDYSDEKGMQLIQKSEERKNVRETLDFVFQTIQLLRKELNIPLIGFCGGPYTVATYMKRQDVLSQITEATLEYLQLQIDAGVQAIQIFDSWAGKLNPEEFQTLALPYLKILVDFVKSKQIPVIVFCRGSCRYVQKLVSLQPSGIGFDWDKEMKDLRLEVPSHIAIQGNLNPSILGGPLEILQEKASSLFASMKDTKGYIFNLGHGILPDTPIENVKWLINAAKMQRD